MGSKERCDHRLEVHSEIGKDEEAGRRLAALLHDSVEDQGGKARLQDVRNRFGERVARIVKSCSDSLADTAQGERKAHWQERKEAYLSGSPKRPAGCLVLGPRRERPRYCCTAEQRDECAASPHSITSSARLPI
jgi:hypothetical protein